MPPIRSLLAGAGILVLAVGCARTTTMQEAGGTVATANVESVRLLPVQSSSMEARQHLSVGTHASDMGRADEARTHYMKAIEADPSLALAHLEYARIAPSFAQYQSHLGHATNLVGTASRAESLLIRIEEAAFATDREAQLRLAKQLVATVPASPRAWMELANVQSLLGNEREARETLEAAIRAAPEFAPLRVQLANSYLLLAPRDVALAEQHIREGIRLQPDEALMYDILGDVHRLRNDLASARTSYLKAAEVDPQRGLTFQQLGHVNSLLGNFDEARNNYDRAISLEKGNQKAGYGIWRALVHVHQGNHAGATRELAQLSSRIDGMNIPEPLGTRINTEFNRFLIAQHAGMHDEAKDALATLETLLKKRASESDKEDFRRRVMANHAWAEGMLAARQGEYDKARAKAKEIMELRANDRDPSRDEAAHEIMGMADLLQGNHAEAVKHFEMADHDDIYVVYHHAVALDKAGRTMEARKLFERVAAHNLNAVGLALVRAEAMKKTG